MRALHTPSVHSAFSRRHATVVPRLRTRRLLCRADEGVHDLISRDRKVKQQMPGLDAFGDADAGTPQPSKASKASQAANVQSSSPSSSSRRRGKGSRKGLRVPANSRTAAEQLAAHTAQAGAMTDGPRTAREAIDAGLQAYAAQKYQEAIDMFEMALELPGNGAMRLEGTVKEYSCASEGEEHAALYNMACAYAAMGQKEPAATCLEGLLESNFTKFDTIRTDPDLASLRGLALEALLLKYSNPLSSLMKPKKDVELPKLPQWLRPW